MTPEARNILIQIVRELLKKIELPESFSDFLSNSAAEKITDDTWTVYLDGANKTGAINLGYTGTEYGAKEDAWALFQSILNP